MKKMSIIICLLFFSLQAFGHGCNLVQDQHTEDLITLKTLEMIALDFLASEYEDLVPDTVSQTDPELIEQLKNAKNDLHRAIRKSPNHHKASVKKAKQHKSQIEHQLENLLTKAVTIRTQLLLLTDDFLKLQKEWDAARIAYFFELHPEVTWAFIYERRAHVRWAKNIESLPYLSPKVKNSVYARKLDAKIVQNKKETATQLSKALKKHDKTESFESEVCRIKKEEIENQILEWNDKWNELFYNEFRNVKLQIQSLGLEWQNAKANYYKHLGDKVVSKEDQVNKILAKIKQQEAPFKLYNKDLLFGRDTN